MNSLTTAARRHFLEELILALGTGGLTTIPAGLMRLLSAPALPAWKEVSRLLTAADVPLAVIHEIRRSFLWLTQPQPKPTVVTTDSELQATSTQEFTDLLYRLRHRAGLRGRYLAKYAGLGTSQLYSMTDRKRAVLPTKGRQVRNLVYACGLDQAQVERVMRLWAELRERPRTVPTPATALANAPTPASPRSQTTLATNILNSPRTTTALVDVLEMTKKVNLTTLTGLAFPDPLTRVGELFATNIAKTVVGQALISPTLIAGKHLALMPEIIGPVAGDSTALTQVIGKLSALTPQATGAFQDHGEVAKRSI
ncbi:hypothetical protein GCM10010174_88440 [Kutzneria viridogrisea]|uniref:XRE family transcriptional regulator n=1 Tax=Kutzneria viridogrisea TaxID=47990 RepID=A0ABR6BZ39_9PSEU|nr:hypothetical protein [Kutzneria viridogrisea]